MNHKMENKHMVDIIFVLALFCVFAISSILLIILGANVYKKTIHNMDSHFNTSTCVSYLTEKLRQTEFDDGLIVQSDNGQDIIILENEFNDSIYYTYIYSYNGYLKEQFTLKDNPFDPSSGQNIMSVKDFKILPLADNLYQISLTDNDNQLICINIHIQ